MTVPYRKRLIEVGEARGETFTTGHGARRSHAEARRRGDRIGN